jgi:hypothetical protein
MSQQTIMVVGDEAPTRKYTILVVDDEASMRTSGDAFSARTRGGQSAGGGAGH